MNHLCKDCGETNPSEFYGHAKSRCARCHNKKMIERQRKERQDVIQILGGKCIKCGFDDPRALQIDHVHGGGRAEQRRIGFGRITTYIYNRIKSGSKDYQLLCANCNFIKMFEERKRNSKAE